MKSLNKKQSGFTLLELVMVVALVGVLTVVAIPNIIGVATNARTAALTGVAGALTAASTRNYATRSANNNNGNAVSDCATAVNSLDGGALPSGYKLTDILSGTGTTGDASVLVPNVVIGGVSTVVPWRVNVQGICTVSTVSTPQVNASFKIIGID
tara:strand:+ start:689 stop:1153 length:465 start_codon:yes stop_codon:yes gene_type:complete